MPDAGLLDALAIIRETVARACDDAGRENTVRLLAATKTVPPARINAAIAAGVTHIGENRVQEYLSKRDALLPCSAHLIGPLQKNKVRAIVGKVDCIESMDSLPLAALIGASRDAHAEGNGTIIDVFVEVNIGREPNKHGVLPEDLSSFLDELAGVHGIFVRGLMAIPPISETSAKKRRYFAAMRKVFVDMQAKKSDNIAMTELSMGMSGDYREAVLEGATEIRIGSALFGARQP